MGFERIELVEAGQALQPRGDLQRAQVFEFADDAQRVVAAHEQRRRGHEADLPRFGRVIDLGRGHRCGGRRLAGQHRFQARLDRGHRLRVGRLAVLGFAQQGAQHVHRGQHRVHRGGFQCALAGAQFVQQRFQHVGQRGDRVEAEGAGAALDRVRGAEHRVDDFRVLLARFERQQASLHRIQPLAAFFKERGVETLQIHAHGAWGPVAKGGRVVRGACWDQPRTFCTVATSCSGLNGLTSQPVAPAALPSDFLSAADSVVSISIGVNL